MFARTLSTYVSARSRPSLLILGCIAVAMPLLLRLHTLAPIVAVAGAGFVVPTVWSFVRSNRERHGDIKPAPTEYGAKLRERREFGAFPLDGVFDKSQDNRSFEEAITDAAYCSNEYGRRLCVICVRAPGLPKETFHLLGDLLRKNVRKTDEVESVAEGEFVVCSHLLRDALSADIILNRLVKALRNSDLALSAEVKIGKAVYPLEGYTGCDLISAARANLKPIADRS